MTTDDRECVGSPRRQGADESIAYTVDVSEWGSAPTGVVVVVKDISDGGNNITDVTATVLPTNAPAVLGNVITLSRLQLLTAGHRYRVEVKFTDSNTNTFECYFIVNAEL